MEKEHKKKYVEAHSGEWLLKYDDLKITLERASRILSKYPGYMPPFNRAALPFETVEILLSDIQELKALIETNHTPNIIELE